MKRITNDDDIFKEITANSLKEALLRKFSFEPRFSEIKTNNVNLVEFVFNYSRAIVCNVYLLHVQ